MAAESESGRSFRLLFVCTGNTCRSPMAEAIARRAVAERGWTRVEVRSAGISASWGGSASEGARRAVEKHGLDLETHRSEPVSPELVEWADLILAMTPGHLARLGDHGAGAKAQLLTAFASGEEGPGAAPVPDPFGGAQREYDETFTMLEELVEAALARLTPHIAP